jgi:hypothetical protein
LKRVGLDTDEDREHLEHFEDREHLPTWRFVARARDAYPQTQTTPRLEGARLNLGGAAHHPSQAARP